MAEAEAHEGQAFAPRILVFSTNNISDPGIDLAGSSHMHYSPNVMVISLPCTSGIKPSWIALRRWSRASTASSSPPTARSAPTCPTAASARPAS